MPSALATSQPPIVPNTISMPTNKNVWRQVMPIYLAVGDLVRVRRPLARSRVHWCPLSPNRLDCRSNAEGARCVVRTPGQGLAYCGPKTEADARQALLARPRYRATGARGVRRTIDVAAIENTRTGRDPGRISDLPQLVSGMNDLTGEALRFLTHVVDIRFALDRTRVSRFFKSQRIAQC
jgi:hypothetical protein